VTPEQTIPERPLNVPWESCITIGTQWAFKYDDQYKSGRELVRILMEVVSKGGNLALNVGPQPDGRLPAGAVRSINELGAWMKIYGEAVYGTRVCEPYFSGCCSFTSKGNTVYCTYLYESADKAVDKIVHIPYQEPVSGIKLVGSDALLKVEHTPEGISITLPDGELNGQAPIAHVFRMQKDEEIK
jgi:alpha-L-fucosidase